MNLYGFASGDPVNYSDPFGLCPPIEDCITKLADAWSNVYGGAGLAVQVSGEAGFVAAGVASQIGGGAGWFKQAGSTSFTGGAYASGGAFAGALNSPGLNAGPSTGYPDGKGAEAFVAGATASAGLGFFITNAGSVDVLKGRFSQFNLTIPQTVGASLAWSRNDAGNLIWQLLVFPDKAGVGTGGSASAYPTNTFFTKKLEP